MELHQFQQKKHPVILIKDLDLRICKKCEKVVDKDHGEVERQVTKGDKNAVFLFYRWVKKTFKKGDKCSAVSSKQAFLWNDATKKIFSRFNTLNTICYNSKTNRLYKIYRGKPRARGLQIRDVSYSPWHYHKKEFETTPDYIAARGNEKIMHFFKLLRENKGTPSKLSTEKLTELARTLRGDSSFAGFGLNDRHIEMITSEDGPTAKAIAHMVASGWSSVGIAAILGEAKDRCDLYRSRVHSHDVLKKKIIGNERQRGKIVGQCLMGAKVHVLFPSLGYVGRIHYKRLQYDLEGLSRYFKKQATAGFGESELRTLIINFLRENGYAIKREKAKNFIQIDNNEHYYTIVPNVKKTVLIRDDGTDIKVDIANPESMNEILDFLEAR